ncbi:GNAT family N-acetyltransferase [Bowmanella denitrificans]|uniref:GNAT family N-acetyltransferase n=1 Tax=Bowmanella denitrificans TaxID=366582 RepID=A0ABN0XF07_9ALTE
MRNIIQADFNHPQVLELLRLHLQGMQQNSPAGHVFALDLSGLQQPDISLYCLWNGEQACGIGALKALDQQSGEIKSMRTHPNWLKQGVARQLLEHIIYEARQRGYQRLMLETGSGEAFEPAIRLYQRYGFVSGPAFADYVKSPFNQFFQLDLFKLAPDLIHSTTTL